MKTKIVCIGAGRLAHHLMPRLELAGCDIVQVYNRTPDRAASLAAKLGNAISISSLDKITDDAALYFITVLDDMIPEIARQLAEKENIRGIVVHCSGVLGTDVLPFAKKGIFYPLQTFSPYHPVPWATTPILITSDDIDVRMTLTSLAAKITEVVYEVTDVQKSILHIAAVFANNFTNHMLMIAENICREHHLAFEILKPLIRETVEKALDISPSESQTGPAIRGDQRTLEKHLTFLQDKPELQELYKKISESIQRLTPNPLKEA